MAIKSCVSRSKILIFTNAGLGLVAEIAGYSHSTWNGPGLHLTNLKKEVGMGSKRTIVDFRQIVAVAHYR